MTAAAAREWADDDDGPTLDDTPLRSSSSPTSPAAQASHHCPMPTLHQHDKDKLLTTRNGPIETLEFYGQLIGEASTDSPLRWTVLYIYRTDNDRYVVARVGYSVVYHAHGSACNTGAVTLGRDLPDDAEPCHLCNPPDLEEDDTFDLEGVYDMELERHSAVVCEAAEVPHKLMFQGKRTATGETPPPFVSAVAQRVLYSAAEKDPYLADRMVTIRRVS